MRLMVVIALAIGLSFGAEPAAPAGGGDLEQRIAEAVRLNDAGRFDEALAIYKALLEDYPKNPGVLYEAAYSSLSAGHSEDAIDYAEQCLKAKCPYKAHCYLIIGSAYDNQGLSAKGEKAFRRGLRESPHDSLLHFNLGVNQIQQEKREIAILASQLPALATVAACASLRAQAGMGVAVYRRSERVAERVAAPASSGWQNANPPTIEWAAVRIYCQT